MHFDLEKFTKFLKEIDLNKYSDYKKIKIVEMDLPKNIQALDTIYEVYWDSKGVGLIEPPSFEKYYKIYYASCISEIKEFWKKTGFGLECDCFPKGLQARIYRTWASLITQIHAGYVAESVFGDNTVEQSTELDHKGIDILVHYKNNDINIQIKKDSHRPEIGRMHKGMKAVEENGTFNIWYNVPDINQYNNDPYYKIKKREGELRDSLKPFIKFNPKDGTLDMLDNGFVIFTKKEFELIKNEFDS